MLVVLKEPILEVFHWPTELVFLDVICKRWNTGSNFFSQQQEMPLNNGYGQNFTSQILL